MSCGKKHGKKQSHVVMKDAKTGDRLLAPKFKDMQWPGKVKPPKKT